MGLFKFFIAALLCLVLIIIVATLFIALSGSAEIGVRMRQRLAARVKELPFYRMLQRRKIDPDYYIGQTPTTSLEQEIKNCEACPNSRQCEETLSQPEVGKTDYTFCPNDPAISEIEEKEAQQK